MDDITDNKLDTQLADLMSAAFLNLISASEREQWAHLLRIAINCKGEKPLTDAERAYFEDYYYKYIV